jgi:mono/diheme cytochrome c family protein
MSRKRGSVCEGGDMERSNGTLRSRTRWRHSVLLAALLATVSCANSQPPAAQYAALQKQGRSLYVDHCELCHGADARGEGELPGLSTPPADLTRIAVRRGGDFPSGEIAHYIDGRMPIDGHRSPDMPVWGRVMSTEFGDPSVREEVTRGKISALVSYLRSIQVE